ncbi:hypothetical protein ILUMI_10173 [Ignelater luminosus]|uniref:Uncharacterized protein n=1 Tax=Ignelater luminosus TaxID=2038154 RepID=A0A8K0D2J8_IGNLU|nr:hypothetical protein ILUMI_10173 [Ignelater luminosus]
MKVTVIFQLTVTLLAVSCAFGQYPPSGYRPQGRQFILPRRPTVNQGIGVGANIQPRNRYEPPQNQYGPPKPPPNQYGAPDYRPQSTAAPPPDQYLPVDVRNNQQQDDGQQNLLNQQNYLRPNVQQRPFNVIVNQEEDQNEQVYREQTYLQPNNNNDDNFRQQDVSNQASGFGISSVNNQQGWTRTNDNANQDLGQNPSVDRRYLAPAGNNFQRQQQGTNFKQTQAVATQLYQSPNNRNNEETNNNEDQNEDQALSVSDNNPRTNFGIANQNYLPPTTTERRKYAEPTTKRPDEEQEDTEAENPNVAIATAIARGQYYILQPDGRLQRVLYKTTQTEEEWKNNAFSAKLVYQPVEPIAAPIYAYNAPLVAI